MVAVLGQKRIQQITTPNKRSRDLFNLKSLWIRIDFFWQTRALSLLFYPIQTKSQNKKKLGKSIFRKKALEDKMLCSSSFIFHHIPL